MEKAEEINAPKAGPRQLEEMTHERKGDKPIIMQKRYHDLNHRAEQFRNQSKVALEAELIIRYPGQGNRAYNTHTHTGHAQFESREDRTYELVCAAVEPDVVVPLVLSLEQVDVLCLAAGPALAAGSKVLLTLLVILLKTRSSRMLGRS